MIKPEQTSLPITVEAATALLKPVLALGDSEVVATGQDSEQFLSRILDKLAFANIVEERDEDIELVLKAGRSRDIRAIGVVYSEVSAAAAALSAALLVTSKACATLDAALQTSDLAELDRLARGSRGVPPSKFKHELGFGRTSVFREMPNQLKLLKQLSDRLSGFYAPKLRKGPKPKRHLDDALYYLGELYVELGHAAEVTAVPYGAEATFIRFASAILTPFVGGEATTTALSARWQRFKECWDPIEEREDQDTGIQEQS